MDINELTLSEAKLWPGSSAPPPLKAKKGGRKTKRSKRRNRKTVKNNK